MLIILTVLIAVAAHEAGWYRNRVEMCNLFKEVLNDSELEKVPDWHVLFGIIWEKFVAQRSLLEKFFDFLKRK